MRLFYVFVVTRNSDDGHGSDRNMLVKDNNMHLLVHGICAMHGHGTHKLHWNKCRVFNAEAGLAQIYTL
jgi:hypothetical protein